MPAQNRPEELRELKTDELSQKLAALSEGQSFGNFDIVRVEDL